MREEEVEHLVWSIAKQVAVPAHLPRCDGGTNGWELTFASVFASRYPAFPLRAFRPLMGARLTGSFAMYARTSSSSSFRMCSGGTWTSTLLP
eukprot:scaffold4353_cov217-Pinguiococcus_pyrenoidosus.AAC.5